MFKFFTGADCRVLFGVINTRSGTFMVPFGLRCGANEVLLRASLRCFPYRVYFDQDHDNYVLLPYRLTHLKAFLQLQT